MSYFKVLTQGQTLVVDITTVDGTAVTTYTTSALSTAHTLPKTITSDTSFHFAATANYSPHILTVTQPDGTELYSATVEAHPSKPHIIGPVPTQLQLAADGSEPLGGFRSGHYYYFNSANAATTSAGSTQGVLRLTPAWIPTTVNITKLAVDISVAGEAGAQIRPVIYSDTGSGYPFELVVDGGQLAADAIAVVEATVDVTLSPGLYWVGAAPQACATTPPTLRVVSTGGAPFLPMSGGTSLPGANGTVYGYTQSSVTGTPPATFTSTLATAGPGARMIFKVA